MTRVRTRFAPSPTGRLHVGNARIAVLNWLLARHHGGAFVLRIEDTDEARNRPGAEAGIMEDLRWLGLEWEEGPAPGGGERGRYGPYHQRERLDRYREQAARLLDEGRAFRCYCTPEELEAHRTAAVTAGRPAVYPGTCRALSERERARLEDEGRTPAIRFHVPDDGEIVVHDAVRGAVHFDRREIGDFVILRSDGLPTYNFAVVVDDALMEISHVVRGAGHLSNTPRQLAVYDALGFDPPVFAHIPTVLGPDRKKLSKRHGARPVAEYRAEGYHADALVNYLSLLSWSSPSGDEVLDRARLIDEISLDRIGAADVVFDPAKLRWLSAKHIEAMGIEALTEAVAPYVDRERYPIPDAALATAVAAVRTHLQRFSDIDELLEPFVAGMDDAGEARRAALGRDAEARTTLRAVADALAGVERWEQRAITDAIRRGGQRAGTGGRALFVPVRVAATGREHGPPIGAVLEVLGRDTTMRLLRELVESSSEPADEV